MSEFQTVNPANGEVLQKYSYLSAAEIETTLAAAYQSYHKAKAKPVALRAQELRGIASGLRERQQELAKMMTLEMGKPLKDALAEIEKCAGACDYFSENLEKFLAPEEVTSGYARAKIVKDSFGPVLAIMPWNFPVWQVIRFAAPAVGIGNPILLKHSDLTAGTAKIMTDIFARVTPGLLYNLCVDHKQASEVIGDKRVFGVTLTGSARAGKEVAQVTGRHLKKTVLELGGSDAYVVFADSDVEKAAEICAQARMVNNGQSCVAAKRFIVQNQAVEKFVARFEKTLMTLAFGDPLDTQTSVGSLAAKKFQKQLLEQCGQLEKAGAKKIYDARETFGFAEPGAFFPARIYHVKKELELAYREEFFGPVALIFNFEDEAEALEISNRSSYGLGGAVFSNDVARAEKFARLIEAGFMAINDQVKSDVRLPFGGVKDSGYGRELSLYGFNEFCNIKTLGFGKT